MPQLRSLRPGAKASGSGGTKAHEMGQTPSLPAKTKKTGTTAALPEDDPKQTGRRFSSRLRERYASDQGPKTDDHKSPDSSDRGKEVAIRRSARQKAARNLAEEKGRNEGRATGPRASEERKADVSGSSGAAPLQDPGPRRSVRIAKDSKRKGGKDSWLNPANWPGAFWPPGTGKKNAPDTINWLTTGHKS